MSDDDLRSVDVRDVEHFRRRCGIQRGEAREHLLLVRGGSDVEMVHHHHSPKCNFLSDLATRSVFSQRLQDAIFRGKFSACHHPGRTGTLTASPAFGSRLPDGNGI